VFCSPVAAGHTGLDESSLNGGRRVKLSARAALTWPSPAARVQWHGAGAVASVKPHVLRVYAAARRARVTCWPSVHPESLAAMARRDNATTNGLARCHIGRATKLPHDFSHTYAWHIV